MESVVKPLIIKPSDPLFGVLSEDQYESTNSTNWAKAAAHKENKVLAKAIKATSCPVEGLASDFSEALDASVTSELNSGPFKFNLTGYRIGFYEAGPSGEKKRFECLCV
ncbi:unnamed protein product [Microthlaspi erraticum]|uniref:Uncharacterized protein n=1 Tax=Microthlaspi erraticum TaxID=1685480 RepID=A0A6D2LCB9_9BRAS|nr:unnamed protein product [Microthlaspi erraticum]